LKKVKKVPVEKQDVLETHAAMFNPTELLADEQLRWWRTDAKRPEQKKEPVRVRITTVPIYRPKPKNEDNLRQGQKAAYTASRVETIQLRKADVHQDHIRPQLLSPASPDTRLRKGWTHFCATLQNDDSPWCPDIPCSTQTTSSFASACGAFHSAHHTCALIADDLACAS
jgi:hypothetical protein